MPSRVCNRGEHGVLAGLGNGDLSANYSGAGRIGDRGAPIRKKIDIAKDKLASVDRDACSMFVTP
jgi:hypothetical protein